MSRQPFQINAGCYLVVAAGIAAAFILITPGVTGASTKPPPVVGCCSIPPAPHPRVWRIMPFGDSITAGQTWPVADFASGWRPLLAPMIKDTFVYVGTLTDAAGAHEGHGGWTTVNLAGIATATVTASAPDYVLLMAGTNDIHQRHGAAQVVADFDVLLSLVRAAAPGATIVIGQIPYVVTWDAGQRAAADTLNAHIAAISGPWVAQLRHADMRDVHISADGVHPDTVGYPQMADRWLPFLPVHGLRPVAGR